MRDLEIRKINRVIQHNEDRRQAKLFRREKTNEKEGVSIKRKCTTLVIPNRTTYMKVGKELEKEKLKDTKNPDIPEDTKFLSAFTPVQLKVLVFIIKEIQKFIQPQLEDVANYAKNKSEKNRAELVNGHKSRIEKCYGSYYCDIPKKLFVSGRNYARLEKEIHSLAWIPVQFKNRHPKTNKMGLKSTTLFSVWHELESDRKKERTVTIEIQYDVLMLLSSINVAAKGEVLWDSDYYSKIGYEVILNSKKKYTGLLYFYLCPWRNKGGWRVKKEEIRKLLGLAENKYSKTDDVRKRILDPASKELREIGDFWFETRFDGEYIVFKIINSKKLVEQQEKVNSFVQLLKSIHLTDDQIKKLNRLVTRPELHSKSQKIIAGCMEQYYKTEKSDKKINLLPEYIYTALKRFNDKVKPS